MRFQFYLQSIIRYAFEVLIYGNLWIALMSLVALWQAGMLLDLVVPHRLYYLVFAATFSYYNLDRLIEQKPDGVLIQARHLWIKRNARPLAVVSLGCGFWAGYLLYHLPLAIQLLLSWLVLISVLYSVAIPVGKKKWSLKQTGLLKPILIGYVWVNMSFILLLVYYKTHPLTHWELSFGYGLFITALCLPFDFRDRFIDRNNSMALIGRNGKATGVNLLILLFLLGQVTLFLFSEHSSLVPYLVPSLLLTSFVCYQSMRSEKEWMYSFGIDGLILAQGLSSCLYFCYR